MADLHGTTPGTGRFCNLPRRVGHDNTLANPSGWPDTDTEIDQIWARPKRPGTPGEDVWLGREMEEATALGLPCLFNMSPYGRGTSS